MSESPPSPPMSRRKKRKFLHSVVRLSDADSASSSSTRSLGSIDALMQPSIGDPVVQPVLPVISVDPAAALANVIKQPGRSGRSSTVLCQHSYSSETELPENTLLLRESVGESPSCPGSGKHKSDALAETLPSSSSFPLPGFQSLMIDQALSIPIPAAQSSYLEFCDRVQSPGQTLGLPSYSMEIPEEVIPVSEGPNLNWSHFMHCEEPVVPLTSPTEIPYHHSSDFPSDLNSKYLYDGSSQTVEDCLVAVITFAQSAHLSGQEFLKLLDLMGTILPQPNNLPRSSHGFFQAYKNDENELHVYYYCSICWEQRQSIKDTCTSCTDPKKKVIYFLVCPLAKQLEKVCSKPGFLKKIDYKNTRTKIEEDNIEDVYDGSVYQTVNRTLLKDTNNITLTWYTDGVSPFKSSPFSMWMFIFIINELPPLERYKPENIIVGGYWGCSTKPHPNFFLLPVYQEVLRLSHGLKVKFYEWDEDSEIKVFVIHGRCDSPAKACFMNLKSHSGYFACPKCLTAGEKSMRTGNVLVYPHQEVLEPRTAVNYQECVAKGVLIKDGGFKGIFGPSIVSYMTQSDFISSINIDSMHCVYLGITKQLLNLWFDPTYSGEKFSVSQKKEVVNNRLLSLQLPHFVQRYVLGVDKLAFWKASLLRNFILYFCLPVMNGILLPEYYEHLTLLVDALALLNSCSISAADIAQANNLLRTFCRNFEQLYSVKHMSFNMHLLRHLSQSVQESGNLCLTSCFEFEDLNGKLTLLTHGTTHFCMQIHSQLCLLSELEVRIASLGSPALKALCERLTKPSKSYAISEKICSALYAVGDLTVDSKHWKTISELLNVMFGMPAPSFQTFERLLKGKILFVSLNYHRGSRISHHCKYKCGNDIVYGKIQTFVKCLIGERPQYFALISRSVFIASDIPRYLEDSGLDESVDLIPISNLLCVCFCLKVNDKKYVIAPFNPYEME